MRTPKITSRTLILASIIAGLSVATVAFKPTEKTRSATESPSPTSARKAEAAPQATGQIDRVQLIRVFIHPHDIYPSYATVQAGKVLFVAENETASDISLVVDRIIPGQSSQRATKLSTPRQNKRNKQETTLGPGEYLFYEESNPLVTGKLIVEPK